MFLNTVLIVVDKILILHAVNKNGIRISLLFFFLFVCGFLEQFISIRPWEGGGGGWGVGG